MLTSCSRYVTKTLTRSRRDTLFEFKRVGNGGRSVPRNFHLRRPFFLIISPFRGPNFLSLGAIPHREPAATLEDRFDDKVSPRGCQLSRWRRANALIYKHSASLLNFFRPRAVISDSGSRRTIAFGTIVLSWLRPTPSSFHRRFQPP